MGRHARRRCLLPCKVTRGVALSRLTGILSSSAVMDAKERDELAVEFGKIACEAGSAIMAIPAGALGAERKRDGTPVSRADIEAEHLIRARLLAILPELALIAEESFEAGRHNPAPERFLLVDPLDGTREFLAGHTDFTVNIALIEAGRPVAGAICAPALAQVYLGGTSAHRATLGAGGAFPGANRLTRIEASAVPDTQLRGVASRSHLDAATERFLREHGVEHLRPAGSSLKFCFVACGEADVYPRLAPTMEWDTAAGHAILRAAGGCVVGLDGAPLRYGKSDAGFRNEGFIAWGRRPSV
jgi:3'(2'), 5'-bisphosphate nucleotidase